MKLFWRRICIFTLTLLCFTCTNISASPLSKTKTSTNYLSPFLIPTNTFFSNSWVGLCGFDTKLHVGKLGYTSLEAYVYPSSGAYYSKLSLNLQQYKKGKWVTIYNFSQNKKGTNGCYKNRFVYKGYKYRIKNNVSVYKSKGGKLLNSRTFYSSTKKY